MNSDLSNFLRPARPPRILLVGDMILDRYQYGTTERISPEAPIPVLTSSHEEHRLGGCGNVAANLAALGAETRCVAVVGEDDAAERIRELLAAEGLSVDGLIVDPSRPTTRKTRVVSQNQQLLRVDEERVGPLDGPVEAGVLEAVARLADGADIVVISDYGKGVLNQAVLDRLCRMPGRQRVLVDPKGFDYTRYRGASIITPNRVEAEKATGIRLDDAEGVRRAAVEMCALGELEAVVITLGAEGMFCLVADGSEEWSMPARARSVYDVTGAGDTAVAVLAHTLAAGADLRSAMVLANAAAGVTVQRFGVAAISPEEIEGALDAHPARSQKVVNRDELLERLTSERRSGRRVVFTNGCFDVLHIGHLHYLQRAAAEGDLLVVGVNDDASVRRLKGEGRPVNQALDRAGLLAGFECVSLVTLFGEDTPLELIQVVKPDVLVKGADWADKGVVGREFVEQLGGKVVLAPLDEGYSSTSTLQRLGLE